MNPFQLTIRNNYNNVYAVELRNKYQKSVSQLSQYQQKAIYDIANLAYKAGRLDAARSYKIQKSKYYDDEDDD